MAKKVFQQSIRVNGRAVRSPKFSTRADLETWINERKIEKRLFKEGAIPAQQSKVTMSQYFNKVWFPRRKLKKTKATWGSDEQRFRDYIEPVLGHHRVTRINSIMIKDCLTQVVAKHELSVATRTRVRALLSKIFADIRSENPPLRTDNPAFRIQFDDQGDAGEGSAVHLAKKELVVRYLEAAKEISPNHLIAAALGVMAGLRKSEKIPLIWDDFSETEKSLMINKRFVQAENRIFEGTKAGKKKFRVVPLPDVLVGLLADHQKASDFQAGDDLILAKDDGSNFSPRELSYMNEDTRERARVFVTDHGLRHSFGRFFVKNTGNLKALQTILGHSSQATTERYSRLTGEAVSAFRNSVSFDIGGDDE